MQGLTEVDVDDPLLNAILQCVQLDTPACCGRPAACRGFKDSSQSIRQHRHAHAQSHGIDSMVLVAHRAMGSDRFEIRDKAPVVPRCTRDVVLTTTSRACLHRAHCKRQDCLRPGRSLDGARQLLHELIQML
jgi:hypothetical protein